MSKHSLWHRESLYGQDRTRMCQFSSPTFARHQFGNFNHFCGPAGFEDTTHFDGFTTTVDGAGTINLIDRNGGWLQLLAGIGDGNGINLQQAHECFLPAADRDIHFGCRIELDESTQSFFFAGLAITDTDIDQGSFPADCVGFVKNDADQNLDFICQSTGSGGIGQIDTGQDVADATAIELGFSIFGITAVRTYINGVEDTTTYMNTVANIPVTEMAMAFSYRTGEGVTNEMDIDWYSIVQTYS